MMFSETELGPGREGILRCCHGHACVCKDTLHSDSIQITTHYREKGDYQVPLINPDPSLLAVSDRDPLPRPHPNFH
jgi:hypothetical protein